MAMQLFQHSRRGTAHAPTGAEAVTRTLRHVSTGSALRARRWRRPRGCQNRKYSVRFAGQTERSCWVSLAACGNHASDPLAYARGSVLSRCCTELDMSICSPPMMKVSRERSRGISNIQRFSEQPRPSGSGRAGTQFCSAKFRSASRLANVDRVAFGLAQNQTRHLAVCVHEELRGGACRLKLGLRLRNERNSVQV